MSPLDPFGSALAHGHVRRIAVLGAEFEFSSSSAELAALVDHAYAGLPAQPGEPAARFQLQLRLTDGSAWGDAIEPPPVRTHGGLGLYGGLMDAGNFALLQPAARCGLVGISRELLERFPYHARYELLEFAVYTLAHRRPGQGLLPLHAACVALDGRGALLIGASGAGKSTLSLHAMAAGLDFVTEDAAFVEADSLRLRGVANFLHLRADALPLLDDPALAAAVRAAPVIRRRSGVAKHELDLRRPWARLARAPVRLAQLVFLSKAPMSGGQAWRRLESGEVLDRLAASQPFALAHPAWGRLAESVSHMPACELGRAGHPRETALALRQMMEEC